jgi:hypothetical protein
MSDTTICTKREWPQGLFCVGCSRRIIFGKPIYWDTTDFFANAYCESCGTGNVRPPTSRRRNPQGRHKK